MLPIDLDDLLVRKLSLDRRPPDGLLHASSDLCGSLRHSQLRAAGAPVIESDLISDVRLMTGTFWHSYFESLFRGTFTATEVNLSPWMGEGWSGTADFITFDAERKAFILGDLKTIKGEGMQFIDRYGVKEDHQWQLSAYWYALERLGIPLVRGYCVYYLPINAVAGENIAPSLQEGTPLPWGDVFHRMSVRWNYTKAYLRIVNACASDDVSMKYLNDELAPVQERVLALRWNRSVAAGLGPGFDVKYLPHWSAAYCPYPTELCNCREQGTMKIGHYYRTEDGHIEYAPRKDTEQPSDIPTLSDADIKRIVKETTKNGSSNKA